MEYVCIQSTLQPQIRDSCESRVEPHVHILLDWRRQFHDLDVNPARTVNSTCQSFAGLLYGCSVEDRQRLTIIRELKVLRCTLMTVNKAW